MPFPIKICVVCNEEFELKPNKPGFANRCPQCSDPEETDPRRKGPTWTPTNARPQRKPTRPGVRPCAISSIEKTASDC